MSVTTIQTVRLKYLAPIRNERAAANSSHIQYLGLENIESWTGKLVSKPDAELTEDTGEEGTANVFHPGDVLFGKLRPYLAKAWLADRVGVCTTELLVLEPSEKLLPRYLLYLLLSPEFISEVDSSTFGAKMPRANWNFIGNLKVNIPPLETQRRIADYLDRETARIDALIAEKEKMLALLEEKRTALISRAVTRGLNPDAPMKPSGLDWFYLMPRHWDLVPLKWIVTSISSGVSVNASDQPAEESEYGVLKTSAVYGGNFCPEENKKVWSTELERLSCPVTKDTVIMSRMNTPALVGESGYVSEDHPRLFLPDRLWKIEFDSARVNTKYMALVLSSKEARHALSAMATGTSSSMKNLSQEEMLSLHVPLPALDEQNAICGHLDSVSESILQIRSELINSMSLLKERRAALITAAVTGRLDPRGMAA